MGSKAQTDRARGRAKLLIVTDEMEVGGSQRQITNLLCHLDQTRFEPHLLYFRNRSFLVDQIEAKGVATCHLPKQGALDPAFCRALVSYLRRGRFDLVHAFGFTAELWLGLAGLLAAHGPLISSIRGKYAEYAPWQWRAKRWITRRSARVLSNSRMAASFAYERMALSEPAFDVIYNGIAMPDPKPAPLAAELAPLRARHPWILTFVGRLSAEKNLPCLLRAAARLKAEGQRDLGIWLVGEGGERSKLEALRAELGLDHVHLLGERRDVDAILRHSDAATLTSLWEGVSNALLEAMALGLPVIGSAVGGTPEVIQHETTGLLFDSDDSDGLAAAIARLRREPAFAAQLGQAAAASVRERFTIESMVQRHETLYAGLLAAMRRPAASRIGLSTR